MPLRSLSPAESLRASLDLFEAGVDLMRQNLRRQHPQADDREIDRLLGHWLRERPGAEFGDCSGLVVEPNTRFA